MAVRFLSGSSATTIVGGVSPRGAPGRDAEGEVSDEERSLSKAPKAPDFAEIYDRHCADVLRWVRRLLGPAGAADVEDVAHDIFVAVFRQLGGFRGESHISTWLFAFCDRHARRWRRRIALRKLLGLGPADENDGPRSSPVEDLERRDAGRRMYAAIDQLPERYRTPIILFEIEGLTGEEIAAVMQIPLKTVWVRLHRGRARLGDSLEMQLQASASKGTLS